jgi:DNA-binding Xre family transcriptional regulator
MKRSISVGEITADIENGISDTELMRKYGLSEKGLNMLFDGLLKAVSRGSSHISVDSDRSES